MGGDIVDTFKFATKYGIAHVIIGLQDLMVRM